MYYKIKLMKIFSKTNYINIIQQNAEGEEATTNTSANCVVGNPEKGSPTITVEALQSSDVNGAYCPSGRGWCV